MKITSGRIESFKELKRAPKDGDECICGELFENGTWGYHYLTRGHNPHRPYRIMMAEPAIKEGETP